MPHLVNSLPRYSGFSPYPRGLPRYGGYGYRNPYGVSPYRGLVAPRYAGPASVRSSFAPSGPTGNRPYTPGAVSPTPTSDYLRDQLYGGTPTADILREQYVPAYIPPDDLMLAPGINVPINPINTFSPDDLTVPPAWRATGPTKRLPRYPQPPTADVLKPPYEPPPVRKTSGRITGQQPSGVTDLPQGGETAGGGGAGGGGYGYPPGYGYGGGGGGGGGYSFPTFSPASLPPEARFQGLGPSQEGPAFSSRRAFVRPQGVGGLEAGREFARRPLAGNIPRYAQALVSWLGI